MLELVPVRRAEAFAFVRDHHSHLGKPVQCIAAVGVRGEGRLVCVAVLEIPKARLLMQSDPFAAEVSRVASDGSEKRAASMALGAITRAALDLGYRRVVSSTLLGEAGTIYRACNYAPVAVSAGGSWGRVGRTSAMVPEQGGRKVRWEYGPGAMPRDEDVDALVRESVGKVAIPEKRRERTLFDLFVNAAVGT